MVFRRDDACGPKKKAAEKVSETAKDLFYRRGIRAVGVDEIVAHAGVTKPSLYRSYASKDELVIACLQEHHQESRARWDAAVAKAPGDPRKQLSNVIQAFADLGEDEEFRGCPIANAAVEFPDPGHPVHQLVKDKKEEFRGRLMSLVNQVDVRDPDDLADGLILLFEGAASAFQSYGSGGPVRAFVNAAEALIDAYRHDARTE